MNLISGEGRLRLAAFILENVESILVEWDSFARSLASGKKMTKLALRNDSELILRAAVRDMEAAQTAAERMSKSKGLGGAGGSESDQLDNASALHGVGRVGSGFDILEVVAEYRALRATVLRLWRQSLPTPDQNDIDDVTRFNEAMDQSLAQAVGSYTQRVDQSRKMFLAILSHDLRNPLNCIRMAAQIVSQACKNPDASEAVSMIETNTEAISRLVSDLVDFSSTGLGSAMPLERGTVDLGQLCHEVLNCFRSTHPQHALQTSTEGDLIGQWDASRLRQLLTNLLGNALQHGSPDAPVRLSARGDGADVVLCVHNQGEPIPAEMQPTIFDPLVRHATPDAKTRRVPGSIGLGLYIVREIVVSHRGSVGLSSTPDEGTTFTVRLPRNTH